MRRFRVRDVQGSTAILGFAVLALALGGCGSLSGALHSESALLAAEPSAPRAEAVAADASPPAELTPVAVVEPAARETGDSTLASGSDATPAEGAGASGTPRLAQTQRAPQEKIETKGTGDVEEEYDPWEPFNENMFEFNRKLDRYVLKPVAKGYNVVMPEPFQVVIANGFDNIRFVPRLVNSLLQAKWGGAGRELSRFLINSTLGIGGLFDAAKYWGIEKSREDFGQTLAVWGSGPGPYLILPFLEPMTVRDGIGKAVDGALDPLAYVLPFIWDRLGMKVGDTVNDRSLNLELFQGFEESVIDMYSAVRHGYLRRREQLIKE